MDMNERINRLHKEFDNKSDKEIKEIYEERILKFATKASAVRSAIKDLHEFNKKAGKDVLEGIEASTKAMVLEASASLGGVLTKKEIAQLESIAMRVVAEVIGEE